MRRFAAASDDIPKALVLNIERDKPLFFAILGFLSDAETMLS